MVHIPSTMRTRSVGDELSGLRKAAGYTAIEFSRKLGWENSRLSRIENGKYRTSEVDITQYVTMLGQPRSVLDRLLTMLRQTDDHFVVQRHGVPLPDRLHTLVSYETTARVIQNFQSAVVPGLLQTRGYAHALLSSNDLLGPEQLDGLVEARLRRRCLFDRPLQPDCVFYIHEYALRLPVGGSRVMNDQIMHLAFMATVVGVSIRVIPAALGSYRGAGGGPFSLMDHRDDQRFPILHCEMIGASVFMDDSAIVNEYRAVLAELDRIALDKGQSRAWLMRLANEYDRQGS